MFYIHSSPFLSKIISRTQTFPLSTTTTMLNFQSEGGQQQLPKLVDDFRSRLTSMDFHPLRHTLLLVGTDTGELSIWDLHSRQKVVHRSFEIRDFSVLAFPLQESLRNDGPPSITRVTWSPDGTLLGVAYSKTLVHIYAYHGGGSMELCFEIMANNGSVNDLAFSNTNFSVTCGDDKFIKVWNQISSPRKCFRDYDLRHFNECSQLGFSTTIHEKIKLWSWMFTRVDYDARHLSSTRIAYSSDARRLFLSGKNHDGSSYLVEWNTSNCTVNHTYTGLGMQATTTGDVIHVDTLKDRFIAIGDEHLVKFWDMDNPDLWTTVDAEGGLPASPCLKANSRGTLLGVSTSERGIKILTNPDGMKILNMFEPRSSSDVLKLFGRTIVPTTPPV